MRRHSRNPLTGDDDATKPYPWGKKEAEYRARDNAALEEDRRQALAARDQATEDWRASDRQRSVPARSYREAREQAAVVERARKEAEARAADMRSAAELKATRAEERAVRQLAEARAEARNTRAAEIRAADHERAGVETAWQMARARLADAEAAKAAVDAETDRRARIEGWHADDVHTILAERRQRGVRTNPRRANPGSIHKPDAHVTGPHRQPSAGEDFPGYNYWSVHFDGMDFGRLRRAADAERVARAYRDPKATRATVNHAWEAADDTPHENPRKRNPHACDARGCKNAGTVWYNSRWYCRGRLGPKRNPSPPKIDVGKAPGPCYAIEDAEGLRVVGLPAYLLGTWKHYNTTRDGREALFGRLTGRGRPTFAMPVEIVRQVVTAGLFRPCSKANPRKTGKSSKKATKGAKRKSFQAQEFLLERDSFTEARAKAWLKKNGHKYGTITATDAYFHAKQHDAGDYQKGTLHNVTVAKHVEAVVGIPKNASDAASARGYGARGPRQGRLGFTSAPAPAGDLDDVIW